MYPNNLAPVGVLAHYFASKTQYIVLIVLICASGYIALQNVTLTSFPFSRSSAIVVSAQFFDKSASYVANHVANEIDDAFGEHDSLLYTTLAVDDNTLRFTGKFSKKADIDSVLGNIRNQLANRAAVQDNLKELQVEIDEGDYAPDLGFIFTASGQTDSALKRLIENEIYTLLRNRKGIKSAELYGPSDAIYIGIDRAKLNAAQIAFSDIHQAVQSLFVPAGGYVVDGERYAIFNYKEIPSGLEKVASSRVNDIHGNAHDLTEVAEFRVGNEYTRVKARFNNQDGVVLLVSFDGNYNPIDMAHEVRRVVEDFAAEYPQVAVTEVLDNTKILYASIYETLISIALSIGVTCLIVYFTIRSVQAAWVIALSIPLSLLIAFVVYASVLPSINLITITALIIAIGLVVDDSIVVTDYLISHGDRSGHFLDNLRALFKLLAAITLTLVIVYVPYVFSGADYSVVSNEFGLAISIALLCSLAVSIFITPKLLDLRKLAPHRSADGGNRRAAQGGAKRLYAVLLQQLLQHRPLRLGALVLIAVYLGVCLNAWTNTHSEVAPREDKRLLLVLTEINPAASSQDLIDQADALTETMRELPWVESTNYVTGVPSHNMMMHFVRLRPPADYQQDASPLAWLYHLVVYNLDNLLRDPQKNNTLIAQADALAARLDQRVESRSFVILPSDIPGSSTFPITIAVTGSDFERLQETVNSAISEARDSGQYGFLVHDVKYVPNKYEVTAKLDKASYGYAERLYIQSLISGFEKPNYIGKIPHANENIKVYLEQLPDGADTAPDGIAVTGDYIVYGDAERRLVDSQLRQVEPSYAPLFINKTNGLNSVTIKGTTAKGVSKYAAVRNLQGLLIKHGIAEQNIVLLGSSRAIVESNSEHLLTTAFSLGLIFLLLVVLFDSFWVPLIVVLSTVPVTFFSGYLSLQLFSLTDNIYTKLAIITAVGLSSKQAVIMVFEIFKQAPAPTDRDAFIERIIDGCVARFDAIFMTSFSLILGVVPLILQSGYGAVAKFNIAVVIVFCMTVSFVTVLFLVPLLVLELKRLTGSAPDADAVRLEKRLAPAEANALQTSSY